MLKDHFRYLALTLAIGGSLTLPYRAIAQQSEEGSLSEIQYIYVCDQGKTFQATYSENIAQVMLEPGKEITLSQTVSGSGVRYSNSNIILHTKGNKAFIETNQQISHNNCLGEAYKTVDLTELNGPLMGKDPKTITLNVLGMKDPGEGHFQESIRVEKNRNNWATVTLTQLNLPDDSLKDIRYRLNFTWDRLTKQWRIRWVGRQQTCRRGENPQQWTIENCP